MTKVKICGITNVRDAEHALECGADAIGFVFADSPRRISVKIAREITQALGPWVISVGVFVNESQKKILEVVSQCQLSAIQLHGDETASYARSLTGCKVIKAFRIADKNDLKMTHGYDVDAYLLDTKVNGIYGGSGKCFDWKMLRSGSVPKPYILSGGLNPKNINDAVRMLSPYGVDVSSGVEKSPGKKDPKLVREFILNAKKK